MIAWNVRNAVVSAKKCIWYKTNKTYHTSCGFTTKIRGRGWNFCPYCGKEFGSADISEYQKLYRQANKEKIQAYQKDYHEKHKVEHAAYYKEYYEENK